MKDRTTELETTLRQIHADQGGEATFADFVEAVAGDPKEQGHEEAREFIGKLIVSRIKGAFAATETQDAGEVMFGALKALSGDADRAVYARNAQVDDLIHVSGQGNAIFKVVGRTLIDPPDNVEVELVTDPYSEAHFKSGDVAGGEWVCIVQSEPSHVQ